MMIRFIKPVFFTVSLLYAPMLVAEPLTQNQLHATMGTVTNFLLSDDSIRFHGKSYTPVNSPHTGRVWLDRNIGANQKCTSLDDVPCYGDYFQWGRAMDGHESSIDSTTVVAIDINNAGNEFVRGSTDWTSADTNYGNARATNWLKTDGSTVCPVGYRVPLRIEVEAEVGDISSTATAYANFLKLPATGYRDYFTADKSVEGIVGTISSVTSTLNGASYFQFHTGTSNWVSDGVRAYGFSVRCIKHTGEYIRDDAKQVVTQISTRLMWQDNVAVEMVTKRWLTPARYAACSVFGTNCENTSGDTAASYCSALNHGGYNDWRLPNKDELSGIVKSTVIDPKISDVFKHTASGIYWSSTTLASHSSSAWNVRFNQGGQRDYSKDVSYYVRCVR